jgi:hypothetical protein
MKLQKEFMAIAEGRVPDRHAGPAWYRKELQRGSKWSLTSGCKGGIL